VKIRRGIRDMGRNRIFGVLCNDAIFSALLSDATCLHARCMHGERLSRNVINDV